MFGLSLLGSRFPQIFLYANVKFPPLLKQQYIGLVHNIYNLYEKKIVAWLSSLMAFNLSYKLGLPAKHVYFCSLSDVFVDGFLILEYR